MAIDCPHRIEHEVVRVEYEEFHRDVALCTVYGHCKEVAKQVRYVDVTGKSPRSGPRRRPRGARSARRSKLVKGEQSHDGNKE